MSKPFIEVAAGLILRPDGWLLLAERPAGKPWSGWWELPGGKIEAGETVLQALTRELKEELDIDVTDATPWVTYTHEYPKNIVRLAFCRVTGWNGEPAGIEGQRLAWVDPHKPITVGTLLPATEPPLRWLRLPDRYLITSIGHTSNLPGFLEQLDNALQSGIKLVQFREPAWANEAGLEEVKEGFRQVLQHCHDGGARCLLNSVHPESWRAQADGVHWRACDAQAQETPPSPAKGLVGVSAHTSEDLAAARRLNADFAVLGHVLETPSHPDQPGMGWARFAQLAEEASLPVFAIGGQSMQTLNAARQYGAHGIAGMRYLLAG
ncbi:Nudix family hydrolase [Paralcaligenes ureilyticus]|uniref:8-oxo-dGTP diphosphatase n=1 Tax=Paralcaligenes ureilyticus TaxID=627131 RepID=A0A4R3MDY2_9BURK|nr:Nudix family hydrolase [Paralcaligenes ureilyticus]TCT11173.1 8-oxo-dGTP diphosphatase [Paralcaligenes ureilyticus]